jgi:hypothetical protein
MIGRSQAVLEKANPSEKSFGRDCGRRGVSPSLKCGWQQIKFRLQVPKTKAEG